MFTKISGGRARSGGVALFAVAAVTLTLITCSGCGESDGNIGASPRVDLAHATAATFAARGSVEQLYVTNATPGRELELATADGTVIATGSADANGSLIFRNVVAGGGYRVVSGAGSDLQASTALTVTTAAETPAPSFYERQHIGSGYGYLETRDGTKLAINVLLPGPADQGPYPTVIEYSGYDPANPAGRQPSTLLAAGLGYAVVGVNIRGTGCSGGVFSYFETLQSTDGYDAVEIVAAQPWVKGHRVGMVGISYPGITQLFVAQLRPPHLAAIAPLSVIADTYRGTLYPGGILNNGFATSWAGDRQHDSRPGGQPWSQQRMDAGDQVCIDNQRLRDQTPDIFALIGESKFYKPDLGDQVAPETFVDQITVPVFLAGAWQDEQVGPYFATMLDRFTESPKRYFTVTNGNHTEPLMPTILSRWAEFLSLYVAHTVPHVSTKVAALERTVGAGVFGVSGMSVEPDRFADVTSYDEAVARFEADPEVRVLFENGNGDVPGAPVPAFEHGFARWPIPGVQPTVWYLADQGRLDPNAPTGGGADAFQYDPSHSQDTTFSGSDADLWSASPAWTWQPLVAGTAVAYATDPLPDTLVMIGSGSVDLWLSSTAPDVDIQVTLSEIRPDGQEVYVQNGWLRASHRRLDAARSSELRPVQTHLQSDAAPLPANAFAAMRVELFPFAHVFRAGSRLRLTVAAPGGSRPRWTFEALPAEGTVINTIGRSAATPSRVVLPLVPGVDVPTALPPCAALRGQPCRPVVDFTNLPGEATTR